MNTIKKYLNRRKAHQRTILAALFVINGCSTTPHHTSVMPDSDLPGIAVVGMVAKTGLKAPVNLTVMSTDLAALLAGSGETPVTPDTVVRDILGAAPHDEMLAFYARHGRFAPYQVQRMMAADLPSHRALTVRLDSDLVERLPVLREDVVNSVGMLVADRERRIYRTRRTTYLSASLLDLRDGRTVWTRRYKVSPATETAADHQTGGSFSASLAAAMANKIVHGFNERQHPEPPALSASVLALLQEVAYNVPVK